jgi:hypothetical protein
MIDSSAPSRRPAASQAIINVSFVRAKRNQKRKLAAFLLLVA